MDEEEFFDDGRILEQESDNEDLWWDRLCDQKCSRCGSKNLSYMDYYWTEDGDVQCAPRCDDCHYDSETRAIVLPPPPAALDSNVGIEDLGMGQFLVRVRQEGGVWEDERVIWTMK